MTTLTFLSLSVQDCLSEADHYKLCSKTTCILITEQCPCGIDEFQCVNGLCLPPELVCDGRYDCIGGEDEHCTNLVTDQVGGVSVSALAAIISSSVLVCVVVVILLWLYFVRRQRNNTSQESQSALNPLQSEKITDDTEYSDKEADKNYKTRHKTPPDNIVEKSSVAYTNYTNSFQTCSMLQEKLEFDQTKHKQSVNKCFECDNSNSAKTSANGTRTDDDTSNAYQSCRSCSTNKDSCRVSTDSKRSARGESQTKLGRYTFKPRTTGRKPPNVYNCYIPSHTEPSTPESVDFDRDKLSFLFAQELLCASTPRQAVKQFVLPEDPDIAFIDDAKTDSVLA